MSGCGHENAKVVDTRECKRVKRRRRYLCPDCGERFTTAEVIVATERYNRRNSTDVLREMYGNDVSAMTVNQAKAVQALIDAFRGEE